MTDEVVTQPANNEKKPGGITGKGFVHGDPRINRKGRPRSFDQIRKLAVLVAAEQDENGITRALEILRDWAKSKEVAKQAKFMEYGYGKVPDKVDVTTGGEKLVFIVERDGNKADEVIQPPA